MVIRQKNTEQKNPASVQRWSIIGCYSLSFMTIHSLPSNYCTPKPLDRHEAHKEETKEARTKAMIVSFLTPYRSRAVSSEIDAHSSCKTWEKQSHVQKIKFKSHCLGNFTLNLFKLTRTNTAPPLTD